MFGCSYYRSGLSRHWDDRSGSPFCLGLILCFSVSVARGEILPLNSLGWPTLYSLPALGRRLLWRESILSRGFSSSLRSTCAIRIFPRLSTSERSGTPIGSANVTWIIRWESKSQREEVMKTAFAGDAWVAVMAKHHLRQQIHLH